MDIAFDMAGWRAQIAAKKAKIQAANRPAAQIAAQIIYEQTRLNAPQSEKAHYFYGTNQRYGPFEPGNLSRSIYQVYSKDRSTPSKSVYHVSWNTKIGGQVSYAPYGGMVEFGTSRAPAHPFLGRAIHDMGDVALKAMRLEFIQRVSQ